MKNPAAFLSILPLLSPSAPEGLEMTAYLCYNKQTFNYTGSILPAGTQI